MNYFDFEIAEQLNTYLYIIFDLNISDYSNIFFKGSFQSSQLQSVFLERNAEKMRHVFKPKKQSLNDRDFIIDQNDRGSDFIP